MTLDTEMLTERLRERAADFSYPGYSDHDDLLIETAVRISLRIVADEIDEVRRSTHRTGGPDE